MGVGRAQLELRVGTLLLALAACVPEGGAKTEVSEAGDCVLCHADEWSATRTPAHGDVSFGQDCGQCHDQQRWGPAPGYVHSLSFPLTLGHAAPTCDACHTRGFAPGETSGECVSCHAERAASVVDPVHAGLSQSCFACHRTDVFYPSRFIHSWPLKGVHALTSCRSCHQSGADARYEGTSPLCIDCHAEDRARADRDSPAHRAYSSSCESCHGFDTFAL